MVVLAATNRPDLLDAALLRSGRFEVRMELPLPDREGRKQIFEIHTREKPLAPDVDLEKLADLTVGMSGSDIESICRRASMESIRGFLEAHPEPDDASGLEIAMAPFERAVDAVRRGTQREARAADPA